MKIALMTDLEGTAGVTSFSQETYPEGRDHILARRLAMAEVNAAVDGFLEAGAEDVLIIDGHGPGGLWFEDMHPEARMLHGRPPAPRSVRDFHIELGVLDGTREIRAFERQLKAGLVGR